jgi:DNA-binding CsgD family transcriptional regulator
LDTEHQLTCLLSEFGAEEDVGIGLNRKFKKFSERDRAGFAHLRPHLVGARKNATAMAAAESRVQSLTGTLEGTQAGLAVVDASGRVIWATPPVKRWLEFYFPNSRPPADRLPEAIERWLQAQLTALKQGAPLAKPPVAFAVHQQRSTLTARFYPVPDGGARLVFSEQCEVLPADRAREPGLTAREAEVLHWISEGKSNPEIAMLLRISPRTVHKHVEHILAKLGVETRMAAVRQVTDA